MTFEEWFNSEWELLELDGTGRFQTTWNEFIDSMKESFISGAASRDAEVAELRNDVKKLREFVKLLRDYIPASAVGCITVQEALSSTQHHDRS